MATVTKPLALDESINTTEQTPRNVADVLAQGLDAIEQAIAGGSGSGGHVIQNASGTDMTQRAKMQFVDAGVTDDSANNKTKVEIVQTISSEADLANAPDGVYQGDYDDAPEDVLDASMVAYKEGSVEDALTPLDITSQVTFTDTPTNQTRFFKVGNTVTILFQGSSKTHSLQELLFTLPSDVRPTAETHLTFVIGSGAYGIVRITNNGEARIVTISDETYQQRLYISASYCIV